MVDARRRIPLRRRSGAVIGALVTAGAATVAFAGSSQAQAAGVSGEAYGHYTKVGLFGGPQGVIGPAPLVTLPAEGSDGPITDAEAKGASAVYGPAVIFGGRWPLDLGTAPGSGPIDVSTSGSPGGGVTSSASITLHPKPVPVTCDGQPPATKGCTAPGGFGPVVPNEGDELHATCTANAQGATGSTRFVNAMLSTSTDSSGEPKDREPIPDDPPPNYTRTGVITNVGDRFKIVYNEQIVDPDGSITVNAIHMFLLGDIAVGEQILGHVRCSMKPAQTSATTALAAGASKANPPSAPAGPAATSTKESLAADRTSSRSGTSPAVPLAAAGVGAAALVGGLLLWSRRRRAGTGASVPDGPPSDIVG